MKTIKFPLNAFKELLEDHPSQSEEECLEVSLKDLKRILTPEFLVNNLKWKVTEGYDEEGLFVATKISFFYYNDDNEFYSFVSQYPIFLVNVESYKKELIEILDKMKYLYFDLLFKYIESTYDCKISVKN